MIHAVQTFGLILVELLVLFSVSRSTCGARQCCPLAWPSARPGIGLGAVFVLMIGGAGASIPEVLMRTAMFKPRLVVTFVVTIIVTAIASGYLIPLIA